MYDFAVIGGDFRQVYLAGYLKEHRYRVIVYGVEKKNLNKECVYAKSLEEAVEESHCVIGPVLFSKDGVFLTSQRENIRVHDFLRYLKEGQSLFGGCISEEVQKVCEKKGVLVHDFMKMDDVAIYNAIATAEGAIVKAMERKPVNLHGSYCLVLGYGRCGRVLAGKLKGLNARVTICARSETARSQGEADGFDTMQFFDVARQIVRFDYIFNTVPAKVLTEKILKRAGKNLCIVDIASFPGGVDQKAAEKFGIQSYLCPSLPGIYAPKSSGIRLAEKVLEWKGKEDR